MVAEKEEERRMLESPGPRADTPESQATDDEVVWLMDEGALMRGNEPVPAPAPAEPLAPAPPQTPERRVEHVLPPRSSTAERPIIKAGEAMQGVREGAQRVVAEDDNWDSDAYQRDFEWRPVEIPIFRPVGAPAQGAADARPAPIQECATQGAPL